MVPLELIGAMCSPTVGGGFFWKNAKIICKLKNGFDLSFKMPDIVKQNVAA